MKPRLIQSPDGSPPAVDLSPDLLNRYLRRSRCLRAAAIAGLLTRIGRTLGAPFQALKQARDRRRAIAELRRLDARTLKDIGVERSQIPLIVEQLLERRVADGEPQRAYPLRALTTTPAAPATAENEERCPPLAA